MLAERRQRSLQACVAFAGLACAVFLRWPSAYSTLEQTAYDTANRYRPNPPPLREILLVTIDDESLSDDALGRFPWPRRTFARIVDNLAGARAIGLDVLFFERDANDPEGDEALRSAIERAGNVVLPTSIRERPGAGPDFERRLAAVRERLTPIPSPQETYVDSALFDGPLPEYARAASGLGFANMVEDGDGRYRRARPCYGADDGGLYPNFAAEVARVATGRSAETFYGSYPGALEVTDARRLALSGGEMWIHFGGPAGSVPRVSAADVARGLLPRERYEGKIVLIGATAAGLYDIRPAPYRGAEGRMFGIELNANTVHSILEAPVLRTEPAWLVCLTMLALGLGAGWLMWSARVVGGTVAFAALLVVAVGAYLAAFWFGHVIASVAPPLVAVTGAAAIALADRLLAESRMRRRMVDVFASYVAPEVAEHLARNPDDLALGGTRRNVTVMFTDIRGFTTISEDAEPQALMEQMTEYFTSMVGAVFRCRGLVDKFIGDGMMALWGCFGEENPQEPRNAVLAALMMREVLPGLNARWRAQGRPALRIGIAVHTGSAIVGNMGSARKWNYTATGDTVNTAARIEELCKQYQARWETTILVSEDVASAIGDLALLERMGETPIRGRSRPVGIYAVLGARSSEGGEEHASQAEGQRAEAEDGHPAHP